MMKPLFWCAATVGGGVALDASNQGASAGQRASMAPWLCVVAMACVVQPACAFNFDDLEKIEKVEQKERSASKAREAAARREEEARRQAELAAAQNRGGAGGAGRGDGANWISVEAECVAVICNVTNLTIGGGPGRFEPSFRAARSGAIHKGYNGALAGQYSYSFAIEKGGRRCIASVSFSANGSQGNIKLNHFDDCRLSNVHAF